PRLAGRHGLGRQPFSLQVVIKVFVLAEDDRVIYGHSLEQHAVGILYRGGRHDDQARIMRVDCLHALAMERTTARSAAAGQANRDRAGDPGSPMQGGRLIDDLVEGGRGEIGELHFDNRPHSLNGRTHRQSEHCIFANGGVYYPAGESLRQILGCLERTAESAYILAVNKHARIVRQRPCLCLPNCLQVSNAHLGSPWSCPSLKCFEARAHQSSLYGSGPGSRCTLATLSSTVWTISLRQAASVCASAQLLSN